jgi:hypothetical protein
MHEKILQGVTVGIVAGLAVYWLTSRNHEGFQSSGPHDYKPLYGDVRAVRNGQPTCACCQCCGLDTPQNSSIPLATDYLDCSPEYAPPTSEWNIGVSLQISCGGVDLDSNIYRKETASTFPVGIAGRNSLPRPVIIAGSLSCSPDVPLSVECTEVV